MPESYRPVPGLSSKESQKYIGLPQTMIQFISAFELDKITSCDEYIIFM